MIIRLVRKYLFDSVFPPYGYIDKTGQFVIRRSPTEGEFLVGDVQEGFAIECDSKCDLYRFIDTTGKVAFSQFGCAQMFSEGMAAVKINCAYGFIDNKGVLRVPCEFEETMPYRHGLW